MEVEDELRMTAFMDLRSQLAADPDCEFVTADEFVTHLTSHRSLERFDDPVAMVLGLRDVSTGKRVLVRAEELQRLSLGRNGTLPVSPDVLFRDSALKS